MKTCKSCGNEFARQDSLNRHVNSICEPPESWDTCNTCGKSYKDIGKHYQHNSKHRPSFTDRQKEIITGILLGDGFIKEHQKDHPRFAVSMVTEEYIRYIKKELSPFCKDIYLQPMRRENRQQLYNVSTITHPELSKFGSWYSSGEKVYPNNLTITPLILKHWYVTDGGIYSKYNRPQIRCWNERKNIEKVESYFDDLPLTVSFSSGTVRFPSSKYEFFDYIGDPVPGFERKWPISVK